MTRPLRVGSLCTGIAGLEHGLRLAGVHVNPVFVSDIDNGANTWLAANMPNTPNLGDFTELDELPEVDIITAGFPCQPFSTAGKRGGLDDERYLFDDIARLVGRMESRPLLFLENVPGLLTANNGDAMGRVVHSLAEIGYRITWGTLPAAAVGAPHQRLRWWGLAYPQDTGGVRERCEARFDKKNSERSNDRAIRSGSDAADTDGSRRKDERFALASKPQQSRNSGHRHAAPETFGRYAPAIDRWEHILGRPAPEPTDNGRLNPPFVEWMMGYPQGWVTDTLTNRRHSLHALGNAVVPQCAAAAFQQLTTRICA